MTLLNENFSKELQRMSELAGISPNLIAENAVQGINLEEKDSKDILKEQNDDLLDDISDLLDDETEALSTQGKSEGKLTKDLKAAMVLNNISQYDAAKMGLSGDWKSHTPGANPEREGGTKGTVYTKNASPKFDIGSSEYDKLDKHGLTQRDIDNMHNAGLSQKEIDKALEKDKKIKRSAITWGTKGNDPNTTKWQPKPKNGNIISYEKIEENGKKLFKISKVGKEQLEFLQRMLSDRPLPKNGDENIDIESILLNTDNKKWPYKNLVITNAEHIVRDFFSKAIISIISNTLSRNTKSPIDSQFVVFLENAINHAIDQTKEKKYKQESFNNYGAWFIQIAKNKVIDQLKGISHFTLDKKEVYDRLFAQNTPLVIDSKLNPEEALSGNYSVTTSPYSFEDAGVKKPYFRYTFKNPIDAAGLFGAKADGNKKSPVSARFLKNPREFYKSISKDKPTDLTKTTYEPGEGSIAERGQYEGIPAEEVINIAKKEVDDILDEVAIEMLNSEVGEGEKVKLERIGELLDPKITKKPELFKDLDPKKEYTVTKKEPYRKSFLYTIIDDAGKEIKLTGRYAKPLGTVSSAGLSLGKNYKNALIEALRLMLQYGQLLPKYSKTVYFPDNNGQWIKKDVGSNVLKADNGDFIMPYKYVGDNKYEKFKHTSDLPITYVWDSSGKLAGNTEKIIDQLSNVALEKNIELPPSLFDNITKEAKYKTANSEKVTKDTVNFMNAIRLGLRKFFGFTGEDSPAIKKDRNFLNLLLKNYETSQLAENHVRKVILKMMTERLIKK